MLKLSPRCWDILESGSVIMISVIMSPIIAWDILGTVNSSSNFNALKLAHKTYNLKLKKTVIARIFQIFKLFLQCTMKKRIFPTHIF